jgi:hypothetical protein
MLQRRHRKLDIRAPRTDVGVDLARVVVSVVAGFQEGAPRRALAGAAATGEALAGAELPLHGVPDSMMRRDRI